MKSICKTLFKASGALVLIVASTAANAQSVRTENVEIRIAGDYLNVNADIVLDSLRLKSNQQVFITPEVRGISTETIASWMEDSIGYIADSSELTEQRTLTLPSVLVNGRNMHISYERGMLRQYDAMKNHDVSQEIRRVNGTAQSVPYSARIPVEDWMRGSSTSVSFVYDACGCGVSSGETISEDYVVFANPVHEMNSIMILPEIEEVPVQIHEGRARIQFEVNKTALHIEPYTCRNGQRIDNRDQIQMIDDSVRYAVADPNVEISEIDICGYASPESSYLHNQALADGRSQALAEYLADRYSLPRGSVKYSSVAENWSEFRDIVLASQEITEDQRRLLLDLIEAPADTPEEFDLKEKRLKTDSRLSSLYKKLILPEWFPHLRATTFAIHTRLKDLNDEQLMEVIKTTPEKMSLNQMYRVARMYPDDSDEFNDVMLTALKYYPRDQIAITNAATAAVARGEYDRASQLLSKATENTPEVYNLLGIIATAEEKYDEARRYFEKAEGNANAERNLDLLK